MKAIVILAVFGLAAAQLPHQGPISIQLLDANRHRPIQVQTPPIQIIPREQEHFPQPEHPIWDFENQQRVHEWQPVQPIQPLPEFERQPEQPSWNIELPRWNVQIPIQRPQPEVQVPIERPHRPVFPQPENPVQRPHFPHLENPHQRPNFPQFPSRPQPEPEPQPPMQRPQWPIQRPQWPIFPQEPVPPRANWREGQPDPRCPIPDDHDGFPVFLPGSGQWAFFICWGGIAFPFTCPPNTVFRTEVNVCADPAWTPDTRMRPFNEEAVAY